MTVVRPAAKFGYYPALDGIRALAILAVFFFHAEILAPGNLLFLFKGGFLGVDIFFVLSGFLITSLLIKEWERDDAISLKKFYLRRCLRLMPAYWTHLLILFLFSYALFPRAEAQKVYENNNLAYAFFYLTNWFRVFNGSFAAGPLNHAWSLAVEEQFYIFWPTILWFFLRRRARRSFILLMTISLVILSALQRASLWQIEASVDRLYNGFDTRIDCLLIGCVVGLMVSWNMVPKNVHALRVIKYLSLISLALIEYIVLSTTYNTPFLYLGGFTLFAVAVGILLMQMMTNPPASALALLEFPPLVWIGRVSYALYLWHCAALIFISTFSWSLYPKLAAATMLAFALTALSYYIIEKPFLRFKEKLSAA